MSSTPDIWHADTVFDSLCGAWRFERSLSNQAAMAGRACFVPAADGRLHYAESGELVMPDGQRFQARRSYFYARLPEGFSVWFDEPLARLFHEVRLGTADGALRGAATHPCAEDRYDTMYEFRPDGSFLIRHDVRGPRKDYVSVTVFHRE